MSSRMKTIAIVLGAVGLLIGWDIWVYIDPPDGDTISEIALSTAKDHPVLPLLIGIVCGHLFWSQREKKSESGEAGGE